MSYIEEILSFDKENLLDILHCMVREIQRVTLAEDARVYLEDMREGALICMYTPEGELERRGARVSIQHRENPLVRCFLESLTLTGVVPHVKDDPLHAAWYAEKSIKKSDLFPIIEGSHPIGVLALDFSERNELHLGTGQREQVRGVLDRAMPVLSKAHRFNLRTTLNRHLDRMRKRETARALLKGAFELDPAFDLVSALVSAQSPVPAALKEKRGGYMEVLAAVTKDPSDLPIYETLERISLLEGKSLLARLVMQKDGETLPRPGSPRLLFFEDLLSENFERREVFNRLAVRTLLMIPVRNEGGQVACVVNYFTKKPHHFSDHELNLLVSHAEAVGEGLRNAGSEHFEIRVLAEIEELLAQDDPLPDFLSKVVAKGVELVGADGGSIALVRERGRERWLVVEEPGGRLVGAKSRDLRKSIIPELRVGGEELPREQRSLTGYVAHTARPCLCQDTEAESLRAGFFRNLGKDFHSGLAVPILVGDNVIGVINLDSSAKNFFTLEHQRIILLISRLIATRIADHTKISELQQKVERMRKEVSYKDPEVRSYLLGNIIGQSEASRRLVDRISRLTPALTNRLLNWNQGRERELELGLPTLLITGKTGSGKEFVFNNVYNLINESFQARGGTGGELPIRKTNIAAFSGELTYTELFGHRKGAYTGAHADRTGILEEADGGIVFLDEIGDADMKTQVQLLRFLDTGEFSRLGETKIRRSRVILVAATNRDLSLEIRSGSFREDLFHRLSEMTLKVPSLKERREDIPDLARHFLGRLHARYAMTQDPPKLTPEAANFLTGISYPGNIRQLVSILQGALFESDSGEIGVEEIRKSLEVSAGSEETGSLENPRDLYDFIRQGEGNFWDTIHLPFMERDITRGTVLEIYRMALEEGGGVREAAKLLKALPGEEGDPQAELTRFRNFMYKTVGLGRKAARD
ncbi:MAG: sigma-54-dependent Fis family transcriptional regulator [Proteobacteria bacterium]|nr:sigma-54-dependent Fis family transcriptional regulator [Pseudomonadota bacterium]